MRRRALPVLALLTGCSVLPDRPFVEVRRHALSPSQGALPRAGRAGPAPREVLLLRTLRAAPGLEQRALRRVRADGTLDLAFTEEWLAPPAELLEAALRARLIASGRFAAVTAPGSRLTPTLVLEAELTALEAHPAAGFARAGLGLLLLREEASGGTRVVGQRVLAAEAPLAAAAPEAQGAAQAAAMSAAVARLFDALEAWLAAPGRSALAPPGGPRRRA